MARGTRTVNWHCYADAILESLPATSSNRSHHRSFIDVFKSSRIATIPKASPKPPSFFARHQQPYPQHQVLSSFNAAHQRGDWGLKRPLPPVKDAHIIVSELDSQERQTPFTFATEKVRFIKRMREFGLILTLPRSDTVHANGAVYWLSERRNRRPHSPLEHFHPQWNRKSGIETGPWIIGLNSSSFDNFIGRIKNKRKEIASVRSKHGLADSDTDGAKHLVQAYLDIPLNKPTYETHPTAGLSYTASGFVPTTASGVKSDSVTLLGGLRAGRIIKGRSSGSAYNALVHGVVANVEDSRQMTANRNIPVGLQPSAASISRQGRLELSVNRSERSLNTPAFPSLLE